MEAQSLNEYIRQLQAERAKSDPDLMQNYWDRHRSAAHKQFELDGPIIGWTQEEINRRKNEWDIINGYQ